MADTLLHAYVPLLVWITLGIAVVRFLPANLPRLLGRSLYWVGVPWEIFALARHTDLAQTIAMVPVVAIAALGFGLLLSAGLLYCVRQVFATPAVAKDAAELPLVVEPEPSVSGRTGSFLIASTIGNTGFVGLGVVPTLISEPNVGWAVFYSVTNNVIGTYGLGVLIASYFGRSQVQKNGWAQVRDLLLVPSLWAFLIGTATRSLPFPEVIEQTLHASLWFVIPGAFLLMGMRLSQLKGLSSFQPAILPSLLKILLLPLLVGLACPLLGVTGEPRLALVLMAGMPSAFAGLILAEEYELDRNLIASSIAVSTLSLLVTIPLWLFLFSGAIVTNF